MELLEKGASLNIDSFKQLKVKLAWQSAKDFDLGALIEWEDRSKEPTMIYFGAKGDLNGPLYIQLDQDAGVGDSVDDGGNEETMKIMNLDGKRQIHIVCWDYTAVNGGSETQAGSAARFGDDNIKLSIVDDKGTEHSASLPADISEQLGNACCIATIENGPMGAKFVNQSVIGTVKGFKNMTSFLTEVAEVTG